MSHNIFKIGDRVRGISSRTDWPRCGTVMLIDGEQVEVWEDQMVEGQIVARRFDHTQLNWIVSTSSMAKLPQAHREWIKLQRQPVGE